MRSLILFWALDFGNMPLLRYLWTYPNTNWGIKNLEYLLSLASDISTGPDEYPVQELFSILLEPSPFARAIKHDFTDMSEAMDFIQDHVISNTAIDDTLKLKLIHSP